VQHIWRLQCPRMTANWLRSTRTSANTGEQGGGRKAPLSAPQGAKIELRRCGAAECPSDQPPQRLVFFSFRMSAFSDR
jgi:hypothetical protein